MRNKRSKNLTKEEQQQICDLYLAGMSISKIAIQFKKHRSPIERTLKKFGIENRITRKRKLLNNLNPQIIKLYKSNTPFYTIKRQLGVTSRHLSKVLSEHLNKASVKTYCELSEKEISLIHKKYEEGFSIRDISILEGVTISAITKILKDLKVKTKTSSFYLSKKVNEDSFSSITEESAYWIGFLMADGSIGKKETGQKTVSLVLGVDDKKHIFKFKSFLQSEHAVTEIDGAKDTNKAYRISIYSDKLCNDLAKFGVKKNKTWDARVKLLSKNRHFWRGMIDGDGSLSYYKKARCPYLSLVGSKEMVLQFKSYIKTIVPTYSGNIQKHKSIFEVRIGGNGAIKLTTNLYKNSSIYLDRKYKKAMDWKNNQKEMLPGKTKLNKKQVLEIRELEDKLPRKKIAEIYNISPRSVLSIHKRERWSHF